MGDSPESVREAGALGGPLDSARRRRSDRDPGALPGAPGGDRSSTVAEAAPEAPASRRVSMSLRGIRHPLRLGAVLVALLAADQVTKALAEARLPGAEPVSVIPGFLQLVLVHNTGMAFGLFDSLAFPGKAWALTGLSLGVLALVGWLALRAGMGSGPASVGITLMVAGAVGNIVDRLTRGYVIDFVDAYVGSSHWPAFNLADAAICVGVGVLLVDGFREARASPRERSARAPDEAMFSRLADFGAFELFGREFHPVLHTYGLLLAGGFLIGLWVAGRRAGRYAIDPQRVYELGLYLVIGALVGAKALYVVVNPDAVLRNPMGVLTAGGVFFARFPRAAAAAIWFFRSRGIRIWDGGDLLAPSIALGHGIGRLGCFAAGCCYGVPTDGFPAVTFTDVYANQVTGVPLHVRAAPDPALRSGPRVRSVLPAPLARPAARFSGAAVRNLAGALRRGEVRDRVLARRPARLRARRIALHIAVPRNLDDRRRRGLLLRPSAPNDLSKVVVKLTRLPPQAPSHPGVTGGAADSRPSAPPLDFVVGADEDRDRLDLVAARRVEGASRSAVARWITAGRALVDGEARDPSHRCRAGARVRLEPPPAPPPGVTPAPIPLRVLHEDPHLIVLDKQAGLVVHPGAGRPSGTLVNGLIHRFPEIASVGPSERPGLVHRLDRGTSGVMVVARTETARLALAAAFARREVEKQYCALVLGRLSGHRRYNRPIGRDPRNPRRFCAGGRAARDAESEAWPVEDLPLATLVSVRLKTGRTHQARVHLASGGHPVAGDALYGPGAPRRGGGVAGGALRRLTRPALHAAVLGFAHPVSGARLQFRAPLPEDLRAVIERLRTAAPEATPLGAGGRPPVF